VGSISTVFLSFLGTGNYQLHLSPDWNVLTDTSPFIKGRKDSFAQIEAGDFESKYISVK
jgi:hypothetical protein